MNRFFIFLKRRLIAIPLTFIIITLILWGLIMVAPIETRILLYMPKGGRQTDAVQNDAMRNRIIEKHHLNDPYIVQYWFWFKSLFNGDWGYSPTLNSMVLPDILRRIPITAELLLYTMIINIPLGIFAGVIAGYKKGRIQDTVFRFSAFIGTSIPDFILSIVLMGFFYVELQWFSPSRLSISNDILVKSNEFTNFTGLVTIDALLNKQPHITIDAFKHLAMPVITLALAQWATLGRITRASIIEETSKDYIMTSKARGLSEKQIIWKHAFKNALGPAINSCGLSAATTITNALIVERFFDLNGISKIVSEFGPTNPDSAGILGIGVFSIILVLVLMLVLDIIQFIFVPIFDRAGNTYE